MGTLIVNQYLSKLWTPANITTALWLDAADSSTVTLDGSTVSQWNDKSGNGRNAIQGTAASKPTYTTGQQNGNNVLTFDGSNDNLAFASNISLGTAHTVFAAVKNSSTITAATSYQAILSGSGYTYPSTTTSDFLWGVGSVTGNIAAERLSSLALAWNSAGTQVYGYAQNSSDITGAFITNSAFTTSGNQFAGRLNGANSYSAISSVGGFAASNTRYPTTIRGLGYIYPNNSNFWSGEIFEIILVASYLSTSDTERIEGYLAHKWGLTTNLPVTHPYKNTLPYV